MKVLVWATSFGADIWSFTKYLDGRSDVEVKVVMDDPELYLRQPIARLYPLKAKLIRRRPHHNLVGVPFFKPDVTILDNWVPLRASSPKGFVLWHGFGWKGPNDREELKVLHWKLKRAWGDPLEPNPNFRWQCFGPSDFEHRTEVSAFAPENCRVLGAASHDDLRVPLDRRLVARDYPFDVVDKKTVLIAPTWHYGEVFAHWGRDAELFDRLLETTSQLNANTIIRMHDRFRFDASYLRSLERLADKHGNVLLKFKDESPDNFVDMQVSDVLITNFSSIANLFYATRRPTIHVYPVRSDDEAFMWKTLRLGRVHNKLVESVRYIWKFSPEMNGGLLARDFDQVLEQVELALKDPSCCHDQAAQFLDEHMLGADGRNCERIWDELVELVRK